MPLPNIIEESEKNPLQTVCLRVKDEHGDIVQLCFDVEELHAYVEEEKQKGKEVEIKQHKLDFVHVSQIEQAYAKWCQSKEQLSQNYAKFLHDLWFTDVDERTAKRLEDVLKRIGYWQKIIDSAIQSADQEMKWFTSLSVEDMYDFFNDLHDHICVKKCWQQYVDSNPNDNEVIDCHQLILDLMPCSNHLKQEENFIVYVAFLLYVSDIWLNQWHQQVPFAIQCFFTDLITTYLPHENARKEGSIHYLQGVTMHALSRNTPKRINELLQSPLLHKLAYFYKTKRWEMMVKQQRIILKVEEPLIKTIRTFFRHHLSKDVFLGKYSKALANEILRRFQNDKQKAQIVWRRIFTLFV